MTESTNTISIVAKDLSYAIVINARLKRILRTCTFSLNRGDLCAILGPSGAGKSTLLDLVAARKTSGVWSGHVAVYGDSANGNISKGTLAYVYQADCLISTLTVYESIRYAASLNMGSDISEATKEERVDSIIAQLSLTKVKHNQVYDEVKLCGLSGGEKKRLAMAIQIVSDPVIVLLDEPTGGLDSALAMEVMSAVRSFCTAGKTVITTIHQPSRSIFALFDKLLVLTQGRVIYFGAAQQAVEYFTSPAVGFAFPGGFHNPAEFVLDICRAQFAPKGSSVRYQSAELASLFEASALHAAVVSATQHLSGTSTPLPSSADATSTGSILTAWKLCGWDLGGGSKESTSFARSTLSQCRVLMHRTWLSKVRDEADMRSQVIKNATLGLLWGLIFFQKGDPSGPFYDEGYAKSKVQSLNSLLFQLTIFSAYSNLSAVGYIGNTMKLYRREAAAHSYSAFAYAISQAFSLLPLQFLLMLLLVFMMYFPGGLPANGDYFFFLLFAGFVGHFFMFVFAAAFTACASDLAWVFIFFPVLADVSVTICGYAPQVGNLPSFYKALSYVNFGRWQFEAFMVNHWVRYDTDDGSGYDENGNGDVLEDFGFDGFSKFNCVWIIVGFTVVALMVLYLGLLPARSQLRKVKDAEDARQVLEMIDRSHPSRASHIPSILAGFFPLSATATKHAPGFKEKLIVDDPSQRQVEEEPPLLNSPPPLTVQSFSKSNLDEDMVAGCAVVFANICAPAAAARHDVQDLPTSDGESSSVSSLSEGSVSRPQGPTTSPAGSFVHNASGLVHPGEMCAIMGSSGAGKTTLLNILSQRKNAADYNGQVYYNGVLGVMPPFGYVTQEDVHIDVLTVREALVFAGNLRLPESMPASEKQRRVERVLALLLLQHVAESVVGDAFAHGISGGEIKRLSIGVELLHYPGLMFLDEPTTGLDSSTALEVLSALRNLANQQRTIVMTLHQPSQDIFQLFDRVMILAAARIVYFGGVHNCTEYFSQSSYKFVFPSTMDPAEYMIAAASSFIPTADGRMVSAGELATMYQSSPSCLAVRESIRALRATYAQSAGPIKKESVSSEKSAWSDPAKPNLSFLYQLRVLLGRRALVVWRKWRYYGWKLVREIILGIFVGTVWCQLSTGTEQNVYTDRLSAIYKNLVYVTARNMDATTVFQDRRFYYRERALNAYSPLAHWLSIWLLQAPIQVIFVVVFSCITYPLVGLRGGGEFFFTYLYFSVAAELTAYFLFTFVASLCASTFSALHYLLLLQMVALATAGFSEYLPNMQIWMKELTYTNPLRYVFQGMVLNELQDNGNLPESHRYIVMLGFTGLSKGGCAAMLLAFIGLSMFGHYCAVKYVNYERR